jgi:hypothetical protein
MKSFKSLHNNLEQFRLSHAAYLSDLLSLSISSSFWEQYRAKKCFTRPCARYLGERLCVHWVSMVRECRMQQLPIPIPSRWSRPIAHSRAWARSPTATHSLLSILRPSGQPSLEQPCPALGRKKIKDAGVSRTPSSAARLAPAPTANADKSLAYGPPAWRGRTRTGVNNSTTRGRTPTMVRHGPRSLRHPGTPSVWQPAAPCASGALLPRTLPP